MDRYAVEMYDNGAVKAYFFVSFIFHTIIDNILVPHVMVLCVASNLRQELTSIVSIITLLEDQCPPMHDTYFHITNSPTCPQIFP